TISLAMPKFIPALNVPTSKRLFRVVAAKTARRYRTIRIQAGSHTTTAVDPPPTTSGNHSTTSTAERVRTNLAQLRPTRQQTVESPAALKGARRVRREARGNEPGQSGTAPGHT